MGWVSCLGACCICERNFTYNPLRVPSIRVRGTREPICEDCVRRANVIRKERGLDEIVPAPDAYEAIREKELPFDD